MYVSTETYALIAYECMIAYNSLSKCPKIWWASSNRARGKRKGEWTHTACKRADQLTPYIGNPYT